MLLLLFGPFFSLTVIFGEFNSEVAVGGVPEICLAAAREPCPLLACAADGVLAKRLFSKEIK